MIDKGRQQVAHAGVAGRVKWQSSTVSAVGEDSLGLAPLLVVSAIYRRLLTRDLSCEDRSLSIDWLPQATGIPTTWLLVAGIN